MHIFKKIVRGLDYEIYKFSVLTLAVITAMVVVFGTPNILKSSIKSSTVLESLRDSAITSAQKENPAGSTQINFSDPNVVAAFIGAFSSEFLQTSSNNVIDGFYGWLDGKTEFPQYSIDLQIPKQKFANSIGDLAVNRVKGLPNCTLQQLRSLNPSTIDPFTLECQPQGINLTDLKSKVVAQIVNNTDLIKNEPITAVDLPKDSQGNSVLANAKNSPRIFQAFKKLPYLLIVLIIASAALYVHLHDKKRRGMWLIARGLLIAGILLVLTVLLTNYLASNFNLQSPDFDAYMQKSLSTLISTLTTSVNNVLVVFGITYLAIGVIGLVTLHLTKPKELLAEDLEPVTASSESSPDK